jgi:Putative transmembrane protein (PGPGW).
MKTGPETASEHDAAADDKPRAGVAGRSVALPRNRALRLGIGIALIAGGILGFLPVLGFWMIPLGVAVLAYDVPAAERLRRRVEALIARRRS